MHQTTMRNGMPWNESYTYSVLDIADLLSHYFSPEFCEKNRIFVTKTNVDRDGGKGLAKLLSTLHTRDPHRAFIELSINSPNGNRDAVGALMTHAVALIIDFDKKEITYQDPYGRGIDDKAWEKYTPEEKQTMPKLKTILSQELPEFSLSDPCIKQQYDKCSCVPLTIHNFVEFNRTGEIPLTPDITKIRAAHRPILMEKDAMRAHALNQTVTNGIHAVADAMRARFNLEYSATDLQQEAFYNASLSFLKTYSDFSKNGTLSFLRDKEHPAKLSPYGVRLAENLYAALQSTRVIHAAAQSHTARAKSEFFTRFDEEKLNDPAIQTHLQNVASTALTYSFNFGKPKTDLPEF